MISMIIMAIAFLALIAVQFGALNGYVSGRDALHAAELGRRTGEILRIQGAQWTDNVDGDANPLTPDTYQGVAPYDDATDPAPFDYPNTIADILVASPAWLPLVDVPVDNRFNRSNGALTDHLGGKFCVYAKGAPTSSVFQTGGEDVVAALRFQIAVVYPGPRGKLTDCTAAGEVTFTDLDDVADYVLFTPSALELQGLRVAYFGTIVVRRAFLTNFAAG